MKWIGKIPIFFPAWTLSRSNVETSSCRPAIYLVVRWQLEIIDIYAANSIVRSTKYFVSQESRDRDRLSS